MSTLTTLSDEAITLLQELIATPSFSGEEAGTADLIVAFLARQGITAERHLHNVYARSSNHPPNAPVLLLNSHHDTVKPSPDWQSDPFSPTLTGDRLTGLGSNDAGASAISLAATFVELSQREEIPVQLILALTAEEENSGPNGIVSLLPLLGKIDAGIVGEPTGMQLAIAEKGLMVLECEAKGKAGHAAREEGENALYKAVRDIERIRTYQFPQESATLGPVKMTVTQIQAGKQHNVVPASCKFVVDIRSNDCYDNAAILETLQPLLESEINPRSLRLNSSCIDPAHPLVQSGTALGRSSYGSPTLSDQAFMPFPTLKMGPGDSARSHTAGEYIYLSEIREGIDLYTQLIASLNWTNS